MFRKSLIVALAAALLAGCSLPSRRPARPYETVAVDPHRDTEAARAETGRGRALLDIGDPAAAEQALKAACQADLFYGPAHNNLGVAYYRQKKHYLAAWEFQYAARLMPGKPEPKNNLGMVMEAVGRLEDADDRYAEALAMEPDNAQFIGNLARCRIRRGQRTPETRQLLQDLILKDTRPEWIDWARMELTKLPPAATPPGSPPPVVPPAPKEATAPGDKPMAE